MLRMVERSRLGYSIVSDLTLGENKEEIDACYQATNML